MPSRIAIACPHARNVVMTVEDDHVVRWRCRERYCPHVMAAKARGKGERIFHRYDLNTDEITTEVLPPLRREMPEAA